MASFKVGTLLCLGMPLTAILCYRVVKASILPAYVHRIHRSLLFSPESKCLHLAVRETPRKPEALRLE